MTVSRQKMSVRRVLVSILAMVLAVGLLSACDGSAGAQVRNSDVLRIGVNLELSGDRVGFGEPALHGIELAIQAVNAKGGAAGRQLEAVVLDNASDVGRAVSMTTQLATQQRAVTLIGPASADLFSQAASVAAHQEIPILSPAAFPAGALLDPQGNRYATAYRTCVGDEGQGTAMARFAQDDLGASQALVIRDSALEWANVMADHFTAEFNNEGGTVVADELIITGETDFAGLVDRVRAYQFDSIYLVSGSVEAAGAISALRAAGFGQPVLGPSGFTTLDTSADPAAFSNVYYVSHFSMQEAENPLLQPFVDDYRAAYGQDPVEVAAMSYDAVLLVADAISRAREISGVAINQALANTNGFRGVSGTYLFGADGTLDKAPVVVGLTDGAVSGVGRVK